jgi:hypothetical protein
MLLSWQLKNLPLRSIAKMKIKNKTNIANLTAKSKNVNKNGGKLSFMATVTICLPQMAEEKPITRAEIMTLMQSGFVKDNKPCFECRATDHWKRECPKLKNQRGARQQKGRNGQF